MPTLSVTLAVANGTYANAAVDSNTTTSTTTGTNFDHRLASVTTSEYTWTFTTDIGDAGYLYVKNTDATNFVQVGYSTGAYVHKLLAGEQMLVKMVAAQAAIFLLADTATCLVELMAWEA